MLSQLATKAGLLTRLIKWLGLLGFGFFFIKGLLWLLIPAVLAYVANG